MKRLVLWMMAPLFALALGGASTAMAADLVLGPSDALKISVYGNPDLAIETKVSDSGFITFPLIGQVKVGGLTNSAAEKKIATMLESGGFVKKPQVNLVVTLLQSQQVSVLGQVNRPGRYPLDASRTLMDMLALAGGINPDGGDKISLIRKRDGNTTKQTIDIDAMMRSGDLKDDYDLAANDVLYVERAPHFYIYGEVQKPGLFRLERSMTVLQALADGGGLTARGTERGLRIKRRDADGKLQVLEAKYDDMVQSDDVLFVRESWF